MTATSVFDQSGRKLRDVVADPDDAEKSVTTSYAYDAHGQVTSVTREDGSVVRYAYDAVGNVVSERYFASATAATPEIAITYTYTDSGGRLMSAEQVTGSGETQQSVTTVVFVRRVRAGDAAAAGDGGGGRRADGELPVQRRGLGDVGLVCQGERAGCGGPGEHGAAHPVVYV